LSKSKKIFYFIERNKKCEKMDFIDLLKIEGKDENEKIKNRRKYLEENLGI
jgi:hypothetical protein